MKPTAFAEDVNEEKSAPAGVIEQVRDNPPSERKEDPFSLLLAEKKEEAERQTGIATLLKTILQNSSYEKGADKPRPWESEKGKRVEPSN